MAKFVIEGGVPLKGTVKIPGAKNSGFKLLIASLLTDELCTISNTPFIRDVVSVTKIIESLGAKVEISDDTVQISGGIKNFEVPEELGLKSRASFMYIPVLLHRFNKSKVPFPEGDKIGSRPINWYLEALKRMGANVKDEKNSIEITAPDGLKGIEYSFPKNSHTGTEALILTAVLAKGKTKIENAAEEPEVDDLIVFLNKMGAKIVRAEKRVVEIEGVSSLEGTSHEVMPDRNEVVTYGCMALGTQGDIEIENVNLDHLTMFISRVNAAEGGIGKLDKSIRVFYKGVLKPTFVQTQAYPGFMSDWQSVWCTLMTQANGISVLYETIFENRFGYVDSLNKMGANINLFNPPIEEPKEFYNFEWAKKTSELKHAAEIYGPTKLKGKNLKVTDIRSGATLVFAALIAAGKSEISGIEHIERGYEDFEVRLEKLGARIRKVD